MEQDLLDVFDSYFEIVDANTPELLDQVYSLRYQVYCVENEFEDPSQFSREREIDIYDERSVHCLIRHRESGICAATARMVLHDANDDEAIFPIEKFCKQTFDDVGLDVSTMPRNEIAEISRFAVSKHFKRRVGESRTLAGVGPDTEQYCKQNDRVRLLPHITLGLFAAVMKMSHDNNLKYWYAVMEPSLLRLLGRFGIHFGKIGGLIHYHGKRQVCFISVGQLLKRLYSERSDVWELMTNRGERSITVSDLAEEQFLKRHIS